MILSKKIEKKINKYIVILDKNYKEFDIILDKLHNQMVI